MRKLFTRASLSLPLSLSLFSRTLSTAGCERPNSVATTARDHAAAPTWWLDWRRFLFFLERRLREFFPPEIAHRRNPSSSFPSLLLSSPSSLCLSPHHPVRRLDPGLPDRRQSGSEPDRAKGQSPQQRRSDGEENREAADAAVERPEMRLPEPVLGVFE